MSLTLEERLKLFKEKGWTYNKESGGVFSHLGKLISGENVYGYINCQLWYQGKKIEIRGHQLGWYLSTGEVPTIVDHINHIKTDNRYSNLRIVTPLQNNYNRTAKGYSYNKRDEVYQARIRIEGKLVALGTYQNEEEARQAYLEAKKVYHVI